MNGYITSEPSTKTLALQDAMVACHWCAAMVRAKLPGRMGATSGPGGFRVWGNVPATTYIDEEDM